jgi:hypothetical protein
MSCFAGVPASSRGRNYTVYPSECSRKLGIPNRLFHRQLAAGAPDDVLGGTGFDELETVPECASLANQCEQFYVAKGQGKLQAHYFAHRNFLSQYGGHSRLADVDRVASNHRGTARIDTNAYFQLEPGMAASFHRFQSLVRAELTAHFHANVLPDLRVRRAWVERTGSPDCVQPWP